MPETPLPTRLARLARKEIRESLRDRRTLATLLLMPLIVYPLLGMVIRKFAVSRLDLKQPTAVVLIHDKFSLPDAALLLRELPPEPENEQKNPSTPLPQIPGQLTSPAQALKPLIRIEAQPFSREQIELAVRSGAADAGVLLLSQSNPQRPSAAPAVDVLQVICRQDEPLSENTAAEIERRLRENRDSLIRSLLNQTPIGQSALPFIRRLPLANPAPAESPLAAFVPLMLVLMTMTGAVYPAIDLTAGERERGTLEMLMAAPVPPQHLLVGKFAAVFLVATLTALVNLLGMLLTLYATGFDRALLPGGATPLLVAQVLLMLVVFAAFFSAVLLSVTSFARSFREAQAWLIPLMLVSLAPGILSLMPGIKLTLPLALIPLVNIVLLGRELFQNTASLPTFAAVIAATAAWSAAALTLASRIFGNDSVLHSSSAAIAAEQDNSRAATAPRLPAGLVASCSLILLPLFIVLSMSRHRLVSPENTTAQLLLSATLLATLFAALPLLFLKASRIPTSAAKAFSLNPTPPAAVAGALLIGLAAWTIVYELLILGSSLSSWSHLLENPAVRELLDRLTRETSLPLQLACLALVPAVAEELYFRGFLLNGLLQNSRNNLAPVLISSILFAAAHLIPDLALERFPGTLLLGLLLAFVRIRTNSILPGILLHAANNSLLLSLKTLQPLFLRVGINLNLENEAHLPARLLIPALFLVAAGTTLVLRSKPER
jgi:ABC-2 type transport system permease protein/sodium transport system permease protein